MSFVRNPVCLLIGIIASQLWRGFSAEIRRVICCGPQFAGVPARVNLLVGNGVRSASGAILPGISASYSSSPTQERRLFHRGTDIADTMSPVSLYIYLSVCLVCLSPSLHCLSFFVSLLQLGSPLSLTLSFSCDSPTCVIRGTTDFQGVPLGCARPLVSSTTCGCCSSG